MQAKQRQFCSLWRIMLPALTFVLLRASPAVAQFLPCGGEWTPGTVCPNFVLADSTPTTTTSPTPAPAPAPTPPVAPASHNVALTWTGKPGVTGYKVYRSIVSGSGYSLVGTASTSSYQDNTVLSGTTYYYAVTAYTASAESGYSNEAKAVVP